MKFDVCGFFWKSVKKIQDSLKRNNNGYFTWRPVCALTAEFLEWEIFLTEGVEKIKIFYVLLLYQKMAPYVRKCGKILYSQTGHRWQYNMAHALCMLDNYGKNTDTHSEYVMCIACPWQQFTYLCYNITLNVRCQSWCVGHWLPGEQQIIQKSNCKQLWGPLFLLWPWKCEKCV